MKPLHAGPTLSSRCAPLGLATICSSLYRFEGIAHLRSVSHYRNAYDVPAALLGFG